MSRPNKYVQEMLETPGLWVVTELYKEDHYAFVLVEENGVCHQLKPIYPKAGETQIKFVRDGVLLPDGWHANVICEGPVPSFGRVLDA